MIYEIKGKRLRTLQIGGEHKSSRLFALAPVRHGAEALLDLVVCWLDHLTKPRTPSVMVKGLDVHLKGPEGRTALADARTKVEARAVEADPEPIADVLGGGDRRGESYEPHSLLALLQLCLHVAHAADECLVLGCLT